MSSREEYCSNQYSENISSAYCTVVNCKTNMDTKEYAEDKLLPLPFSTKDHHKTVLSYHKLKISFMCMLVLNALLLVVVIICMLMIVPHISTMDNNTPPQSPDKFQDNDHMTCLSIKNKLTRLYRNGQMVENVKDGDKCSLEDFMDSFIQHVEDAMQKEKSNVSAAFHLVTNNTYTDRCQDSKDNHIKIRRRGMIANETTIHHRPNDAIIGLKTLHCLKNWKLSMNTTKISVKDESIEVPSSGPYFLYSRVVINAKVNSHLNEIETITHSIRYSNTGHHFRDLDTSMVKCGVIKNTMSHISYIEKIQYLEQGTQIKVALDFPKDIIMQPSVNSGAFGMFKL